MRRAWCRVVGHRWVRARATLMQMPTVGLGFLWKPCEEGENSDGWGCTRCFRYEGWRGGSR